MWQRTLTLSTSQRGFQLITDQVREALPDLPERGLLHLFLQHTSCSLAIQENADPTAREDLEEFSLRLAPDAEHWHQHTLEGPDDSSAHMKSAVFGVQLVIPVVGGSLGLGTWQGIYLCEHRTLPQQRKIVLTLQQ